MTTRTKDVVPGRWFRLPAGRWALVNMVYGRGRNRTVRYHVRDHDGPDAEMPIKRFAAMAEDAPAGGDCGEGG